jgi:hypothetical protein
MERGQLGALNYEIPLNQPSQMAQRAIQGGQAQGYDFELPDKLAVRKEKTAKLLNNYALLKNFIKSMSDQGIDPFTIDYSQDDGGLPYQTLLDMDAGVRFAAQELANEYQAEEQLRPLEARGDIRFNQGVDPTSQLAYSDPNNYYSTDPLPFVDQANQRLNTPTYTRGDEQRFNQAYFNPNIAQIDNMVAQGMMSPEEGEFQKANLQKNIAQTAYQQLIPRTGRGGGLTQQDFTGRAELIKKLKSGILNNDPTALNLFKQSAGAEDAEYINTGNKVGIQVYHKGQPQPVFIDLSQGGGESEINSYLNRIEGQKNIPNEALFNFDTKVEIPQSNAKQIPNDVSSVSDIFPKLQELATSGSLLTSTGEPVASVEINEPFLWGSNELIVTYFKTKNGKVDYSKTATKKITDPNEIDAFIEANANQIAPEFGGGFTTGQSAPTQQPSAKTIPLSKIQSLVGQPGYEGYTAQELVDYYKSQGFTIK